ncbi:hypothetical protein [Streptomyces sp. NPDC053079]|uniref:hypothetical protein n=1 Tax=Streptomyces sp. NPDC053079 TaxID=3365697 RepID=UPI0037D9360D
MNAVMDASDESSVSEIEAQDGMWRRWAGIALALLIPTVIVTGIGYLSSSHGGRCVMSGEECSPVSEVWTYAAFLTSATLGMLAAGLPGEWSWVRAVRGWIVAAQVVAHAAMAALILS